MRAAILIAAGIVFLPVVLDAVSVLGRLRLRADPGGSPASGVVVFVESIRWLGVRWGLRSVAAGFRRAGYEGEFLYWRWHAGWRGWLVLPAIMDAAMLEREAGRLAEFLAARRDERPAAPIHLVGYSCGGYVAVRALELLRPGVRVDAAALLAPAIDPRRDLRAARSRVSGALVVVWSLLDWFIVGLGTLLAGTGDRKHVASMGMVGPRRAEGEPGAPAGEERKGPDRADCGRIVQVRWRPGLLHAGYLGGHFSASTAGLIQQCVAPAMGVAPAGEA